MIHFVVFSYSILCLIPIQNTGTEGIAHFDKMVHFIAYFLFALGYFILYSMRLKFCTALLLLHGVLIEIAQSQTSFRQFELLDIAADTLGITLALIIYLYLVKKRS